jgi:hypothetical protein
MRETRATAEITRGLARSSRGLEESSLAFEGLRRDEEADKEADGLGREEADWRRESAEVSADEEEWDLGCLEEEVRMEAVGRREPEGETDSVRGLPREDEDGSRELITPPRGRSGVLAVKVKREERSKHHIAVGSGTDVGKAYSFQVEVLRQACSRPVLQPAEVRRGCSLLQLEK